MWSGNSGKGSSGGGEGILYPFCQSEIIRQRLVKRFNNCYLGYVGGGGGEQSDDYEPETHELLCTAQAHIHTHRDEMQSE